MKSKIILVVILALMSQSGRSQGLPVYDNTNFISMAKSLIESAKQTSELLKTVRFLKEQKERLEQVSSVIKQVKAVQEIIDNTRQLSIVVQNDLREILNSPFIKVEEINGISVSYNSIIEVALEELDLMQQLLTSNLLSMSDAERLSILEEQKERSRVMLAEIELRNRRYRTIISFREMQHRILEREIKY